MTNQVVSTLLDAHGLELHDHTIFREGKPLGILVPGILLGENEGKLRVLGPRGVATVSGRDTAEDIAAIAAAGGILFGDENDIAYVAEGLRNPRTSRNFSYYCCLFTSCMTLRDGVERLTHSRATVVGCGGIGSLVAMNVVAAGVGHLRLVDADHVEASNLNRQFFYVPEDVGARKTETLEREISRRFPEVEIEIVSELASIKTLAMLCANTDLIVMTGDEPTGILEDVTHHTTKAGIPTVVAGYNAATGLVTSGWAPGPLDQGVFWHRAPQSIMPSFGPTNVELAGFASRLAVQLLAAQVPPDAVVTYALGGHRFDVEQTHKATLV